MSADLISVPLTWSLAGRIFLFALIVGSWALHGYLKADRISQKHSGSDDRRPNKTRRACCSATQGIQPRRKETGPERIRR